MTTTSTTIELLKQVIRDENCKRMNLSTVKGFLGELIVKSKLESEGCDVQHTGNQSGYDLKYDHIKIDVKFSTYKTEVRNFPPYWGWALIQGSKKRNISCTHFVCVALNETYEVDAFHVIQLKNLHDFPKGFGQFRSVKKAFGVLPDKNIPESARIDIKSFFEQSRKCEENQIVIKVLPQENLSHALNNKF